MKKNLPIPTQEEMEKILVWLGWLPSIENQSIAWFAVAQSLRTYDKSKGADWPTWMVDNIGYCLRDSYRKEAAIREETVYIEEHPEAIESLQYSTDYSIVYLESILTALEYEVAVLVLEGYSEDDIYKKLRGEREKITSRYAVWKIKQGLREKLKDFRD